MPRLQTLDWTHAGQAATPCPVCAAQGSPFIAVVRLEESPLSALARCPACGSVFYETPCTAGYLSAENDFTTTKKFYTELGVGIGAILAPLLALGDAPGRSLLDVGCGFGFAVDFWARHMGGRALGLEMAPYGAEGKRVLGADIRPEYLNDGSAARHGLFDVVYACEVIEHVPDPSVFLRHALAVLAPGGVLCLTTPNAAFIRPENKNHAQLQALAPFQHRFLLSEAALRALLLKTGLPHVACLDLGARLIVWASRLPLPDLAWGAHAGRSTEYLESLAACPDAEVRGGILFRKLCNFIKSENYAEAALAADALSDCAIGACGFDPRRMYALDASPLRELLTLEDPDFFHNTPSYLGHTLLCLALIAWHGGRRDRFFGFLDTAEAVLRRGVGLCAETDDLLEQALALKARFGRPPLLAAVPRPASGRGRKSIALMQAVNSGIGGAADFTFPYTLAVISAWIKRENPETEVFFTADAQEAVRADEVWCTSLSEAWDSAVALGKAVTEAGRAFFVGGHHATALPGTMPWGTVRRGRLENYRHLDELPLPDWSLFPNIQEHPGVLMTSRGCPFSCRFCSSRAFWGGYAEKSAERVLAEIRQLAGLGLKDIVIFDDLFTANKERLKRICALVRAEGLHALNFHYLLRSDTVSDEVLLLLRGMNVVSLSFGSESGDDAMLLAMNKKTDVRRNLQAIRLMNRYGYRPDTSLVIGYPGESKESLKRTCDYIERIRPHAGRIDVYPVIPYPGTPLWDVFVGLYKPDLSTFDWMSLALRANGVDWDNYHLLADRCSKQDLRRVAEWNARTQTGQTGNA